MKRIPVLVTLDVHPKDNIADYIEGALKELDQVGIKATFFMTASIAKDDGKIIKKIVKAGHQVGSHGLYHNIFEFNGFPPERYDKLPAGNGNIGKCQRRENHCLSQPVFWYIRYHDAITPGIWIPG